MTATTRRLAIAVASAAVLGAGALTLPAVAADAPAAGPAAIDLTDGTLKWGVKESFRKYVTGIAAGEITVADGAEQAADNGPFTFTGGTGSYDPATHAVDSAFKGSVRFTSKAHGFDIKLADLKLTTENATAGAITADITAAGETSEDVELADLDLSGVKPGQGEGGAMTFADIPAKLTAKGAAAFNNMYEEGETLDPATLSVKAASGGSSGGSGSGGATGGSTGGSTGGDGGATGGSTGGSTGSGGTDATGGSTGGSGSTGGEEPEQPADGAIVDGRLDWGVKESFRKYVTGPIGGGKVELGDGAAKQGEGYRFPDGSGQFEAETPGLDARFAGTVRFLAHKEGDAYALDLKFSDLRVEADGTGAALVADVSSKDRESGKVTNSSDVEVADLSTDAGKLTAKDDIVELKAVPAKLTADGAKAFGGFYKEGDALDPVSAALSLDEDAQLPGGGSGGSGGSGDSGGSGSGGTGGAGTVGGSDPLASTGAGLPVGGLLGAGAAAAALGGAAVYAASRRRNRAEA
ncbi:HtaA domain-containing protein [Streptomyces boninensis]|uniref:HtaA domain-containing protein n=1 Tax=Streptomyces boninensis TaxID=2039455 RepID=UPI003B21BDB4